MLGLTTWKRLLGKPRLSREGRSISFYDSDLMREAIEAEARERHDTPQDHASDKALHKHSGNRE